MKPGLALGYGGAPRHSLPVECVKRAKVIGYHSVWTAETYGADAVTPLALQALKPHVALFVGGMGAKDKNFHKDTMVNRGYGEAADRIQELYLAGHRQEAEAAAPDDYLDQESLIGPPERIRERWPAWRDSGLTGITFRKMSNEAIELMAKVGRE